MISAKIGVSKSTLSSWLSGIPYTPNKATIKRIGEGKLKSAISKNRQKIESIKKGKLIGASDVGSLTKRDLFMIGIALYIGEGTKSYDITRIINSDPNVIRIAMRWFREVCGLDTKNFQATLFIYPDIKEAAAIEYWSKITEIPASQFRKTQIDRRRNKSSRKHKKLPYGTVHITIKACGNPSHGTELHRRVMGWIEAVYDQMRV